MIIQKWFWSDDLLLKKHFLLSMSKTVVLLIFVKTDTFFSEKGNRNHNIVNVFTVTFDPFISGILAELKN